MNFFSRFIRHQVMDNPDQPPEGVTDVPPSPSNDEEPPSAHQDFSGLATTTCWARVLFMYLLHPHATFGQATLAGGAASWVIFRERRSQQSRSEISQETNYPKQHMQEAVPKKSVPRACTSENGLHCNTMSAVNVHSTRLPRVGRSTSK